MQHGGMPKSMASGLITGGNPQSSIKSYECPCKRVFSCITRNPELALYIMSENKCCCCCTDDDGNTVLHNLVSCCTEQNNSENCIKCLSTMLNRPNVSDFINTPGRNNVTPILLSVMLKNELVASMLDAAGADKTLGDIDGNYIQTETESCSSSGSSSGSDSSSCSHSDVSVTNVVNIVIPKTESISKKLAEHKVEHDMLSTLDMKDDFLNTDQLSDTSSSESSDDDQYDVVETSDFLETLKNKVSASLNGQRAPQRNNRQANNMVFKVLDGKVPFDQHINTDELLTFLNNKYAKQPMKKNSNRDVFSATSNADMTSDAFIAQIKSKILNASRNMTGGGNNIDTEELMNGINNQDGGKKTSNKIMGRRNTRLHSDVSENVPTSTNKLKDITSKTLSNYESALSDKKNTAHSNELSRLITSRKDEIHQEVINNILSLLNKGLIVKNSKPVESNEQNARWIKAFLYRNVSEKNPQLNGMDKIILIKKMTESELIASINKMPSMEEMGEIIRKKTEENLKNKESRKLTTESESNTSVSSGTSKSGTSKSGTSGTSMTSGSSKSKKSGLTSTESESESETETDTESSDVKPKKGKKTK